MSYMDIWFMCLNFKNKQKMDLKVPVMDDGLW